MGNLFTLDAATKSTIRDALDDIITEFGKDCTLLYPARWVSCVNCLPVVEGKKSRNRWREGGPQMFQAGSICPLCMGEGGHHAEQESESLRMKVEWSPKLFWYPVPNVNVRAPHSVCQTKFYVADIPKIVRCEALLVQLPLQNVVRAKFRLSGQPISPGNIIQDRYAVATWEAFG